MLKRFIYTPLFLFCFISFVAQNSAIIKGFAYDKESGEPVPFINVYFKGTTIGATTDLNGFFTLSKLKAGNYTLLITSVEHDTVSEKITLKNGEIISKKYFLKKSVKMLQEVEISAATNDKVENTTVGVQKIDPIVVGKLPSVGEPDIAQYLQVLPGVVFTGDQGGQLYIRGGLPVQNKVLLDGLTIYNPFHSIGLFSVFDNDIMKNADVYSAGFGAEYGGRTSSIMDITTRDGNKKRMEGKLSASTFGVKTTFEGPMVKLREDGNTSASYLVSFKKSYLPQTSKYLYNYANPNGLPFDFTDVYAKASINSVGGSKISLFGFSFNDNVNYSSIAQYNWKNFGIGSNFLLVPSASNLLIEGVVSYSQYNINFINPAVVTDSKQSGINSFNTGFNFTKFIGRQELKFGLEGYTTNTSFQVQNPYYSFITINRSTIDGGVYAKYKFIDKRKIVVFEPSFRFQYYATIGAASPEPRASFKINVTPKIRLKGAAGLYSQTLMSANSDRDIVNLFYGFVNAPQSSDLDTNYLDKNGNSKTVNSSLQKASHLVGGMEFTLAKGLELNVEVYQKFFNTIVNVNRDKIYDDNTFNALQPSNLKKTFVIEQGRAKGFDVVLKYDRKHFYFWAVYSLTYNDRWAGNTQTNTVFNYPPNFDRRHNINLVSSYTFGKKLQWEANIRWNYGSGFPFTPTQGFIPQFNPSNSIGYNYTNANPMLSYLPGTLNSSRLPDYHRLDIGVKYKYQITSRNKLEFNFVITNVYNRANIFYVDRFAFNCVNQLPFMPNLNISFTF
ncbi:MAG: TonB-dependent receptor [Bacteroidetes bacterium]|nr:TonB-dependent receptor [Bacteroidota bacterium]